MTITDFISRLQALMSAKTKTTGVDSSAQVKIGKRIGDDSDVFEYFDIVRKDGDVVIVPSDRWSRKR